MKSSQLIVGIDLQVKVTNTLEAVAISAVSVIGPSLLHFGDLCKIRSPRGIFRRVSFRHYQIDR